MKVRFLAPAEIEMLEASAYYEMHVENLGAHYLDIIEGAIKEIAENPRIWPEIDQGIRRRIVRRFRRCIRNTLFATLLDRKGPGKS